MYFIFNRDFDDSPSKRAVLTTPSIVPNHTLFSPFSSRVHSSRKVVSISSMLIELVVALRMHGKFMTSLCIAKPCVYQHIMIDYPNCMNR